MKKRFRWTDELAKEFARVTCAGPYGEYEDCNTTEKKLKRFKELKR